MKEKGTTREWKKREQERMKEKGTRESERKGNKRE